MKKPSILVLLCITLIGCSSNNSQDPYITKEDIAINEILDKYAMWVEKQHQIYPVGTTVGMPNGVLRIMGVDFESYRVMSKQEAREITVNSSQKLLSMINSEPLLQNCLVTRPFEIKNITMTIFIKDENGNNTIYDPIISVFGFDDGYLEYYTINKVNDIPEIVSRSEESYEEAVETLKKL
ncbi:MAG: hypothetical protein V4489_00840 [Chlamydiota bacterium]